MIASTNDSLRAYNAQSGFLRYSIEPLEHIADFVLNKEELVFATDSSLNVYDLETGKEQSKVNLAYVSLLLFFYLFVDLYIRKS